VLSKEETEAIRAYVLAQGHAYVDAQGSGGN
jgi:hypothetical protein